MSVDSAKTKSKAVKALRTLLNAAAELTEAEKVLQENPSQEADLAAQQAPDSSLAVRLAGGIAS